MTTITLDTAEASLVARVVATYEAQSGCLYLDRGSDDCDVRSFMTTSGHESLLTWLYSDDQPDLSEVGTWVAMCRPATLTEQDSAVEAFLMWAETNYDDVPTAVLDGDGVETPEGFPLDWHAIRALAARFGTDITAA